MDRVAVGRVFIRVLPFSAFSLVTPTPLILSYMLLLRGGETDEALELPNSGARAEMGALDRKIVHLFGP